MNKVTPLHSRCLRTVAVPRAKGCGLAAGKGFSLVELLVVIAIIAMIAAFAAPATNAILRGSQLTQAAQMLSDQLGLARQMALSKNHIVEVRFYQLGDEGIPGEKASDPNTGRYRAFQSFEIQESGTPVAVSKMQRVPSSIIIDSGSADAGKTLSSIIGLAQNASSVPTLKTGAALNVSIPRAGIAYNSVSFRFLPDGSTNLSSLANQQWFLTLHSLNDGDRLNGSPANFFTIQIDAINGHIRTFRP